MSVSAPAPATPGPSGPSGPSGTEPLVRVYTEATSPDAREAMIAAGERLVRDA